MTTEIVCERCGVDDHLTGTRRDDDLIELHCSACELTFTRDPRPSCPKCGGFRMLPCQICRGSKKSRHRNNFTETFVALRCSYCDDSALMRCDLCA